MQNSSVLSDVLSNCITVEYTKSLQPSASYHNVEIINLITIDPSSYDSYSVQIQQESNANINVTVSETNFHKYKSCNII